MVAADRAAEPAGHAIEVRITAEDPSRDFTPVPGRVGRWLMPAGPGVRVDTAIEAGNRVPPEYDNLIAKIMVHAGDRPAAIRRLRRALDETEIAGIQTSLPFHRFVARSESFAAGALSTDWVGEHWDGPASLARAARIAQLAAGLDALDPGVATGVAGVGSARVADPVAPRPDDGRWASSGRQAAADRWPR
jgi:acetyl/propionyl-CoA carboxylase alpha subunit